MMNFSIGIPLDADAGKAARIARKVLLADGRVRKTPPPGVFIDAANDNFLFLGVRAWLPVAEFWPAHRALIAAIREKLKGEGIIMQRFVHPAPDIGAAAEDEEAETPVRQARALRRGSR
jgi:small-conductance mechanosensitive channel